ncbi:hypothetical protein M758_2G188000 [Ceratodon purpureus]|nr:hypothetical protein M758_2G188000 [Ceratodon purpureus]
MPAMAEALHKEPALCGQVPSLFSSFVDSFVDYAVAGQVLGKPAVPPSVETNALDAAFTKLDVAPPVVGHGEGLRTWLPAAKRLIAIGDIHGDLAKARAALQVAQVIDEHDRWVGGETVLVQVGDLFDRGGDEIKILYLLEKLRGEAQKAGGDVHVMNGNHEIMNIEGDFRYATRAGLEEFRGWAHWFSLGNILKSKCAGLGQQTDIFHGIPDSYPPGLRARMAAMRPGGPLASRFLSKHPVVLVVGSSVFVHGGLLPEHVNYGLDRINDEVSDWMLGTKGWKGPGYLHGADALVWTRKYSDVTESRCDCELLTRCLRSIDGVKRMVVGHTIQQPVGLNGACDNKVIRVDVGLSKGCADGMPQVLEIRGDKELRVLSSRLPPSLIDAGAENGGFALKEKSGLASLLVQAPQRYA